jgi:DsbC/DsbD-like thiol-disulfide interchange protein
MMIEIRHECFMRNILSGLFLTMLAVLPVCAHAASSDWAVSGDTRMRLVVAEPRAGDKSVRAALEVELASGWKTYWQDPGDAGVPLQIDASGSQNVNLKAIRYPAPHRFDDGVTTWAGYKEPVHFALELERPDAGASGILNASVFIGICENICVPFQANFSVPVNDASTTTSEQVAVDAAFKSLPGKASADFGVLTMKNDGKKIWLDAKVTAEGNAPELFIAAPAGWQFGAPKLVAMKDKIAQFEAEVLFAPKNASKAEDPVVYTLIDAGNAVTGTVIQSQ